MKGFWRRMTEMGRQRSGSEDRRKAKKRKHSSSKNRSEKSLRTHLRTHLNIYLHWCLLFFLPSVLPGADSLPVVGEIGGSITLKCNSDNTQDPILTFGTRIAYGVNQDEHFRDRVHKTDTCDLILQDLKTTDAGKYLLTLYVEGEPLCSYSYEVRVDVNLTALIGEEVMLADLPGDAESVEHLTNTGSTEVWRRRMGVLTDRLMDKDGHLIIRSYTLRDAGTYRVLNSTGGVLVTVTLTESKYEQDSTRDDNTKGTERHHVWVWMMALVAVIAFTGFMIYRCLNRNKAQGVLMKEIVQLPI
ncbi:uncharacterized protein LOC127935119 isoform X1 [Carassius gibelio]|uniref:uncharacterized protein LOC127935119 isoform X1 n=2 Tax=Carassius gibelio TaxID=101364 RepID=UPI0022783682|nr:uncharacterized protein LOC127935119 isoform X1 [Carassius gibelio]